MLVTAGLGMVAYTGWLLDSTPVWYLWWPAAIAPAVVVVIGAAMGWRNVVIIAVLATAWYGVLATVDLVVSTPVGVVEVPVALAAIGVTTAAWAVDPHPLDQSAPDQPPLANTAG